MKQEEENVVALQRSRGTSDNAVAPRECNLSLAELMQDSAEGLGIRIDERGCLVVSRDQGHEVGS